MTGRVGRELARATHRKLEVDEVRPERGLWAQAQRDDDEDELYILVLVAAWMLHGACPCGHANVTLEFAAFDVTWQMHCAPIFAMPAPCMHMAACRCR